jgi:hypothetical protein
VGQAGCVSAALSMAWGTPGTSAGEFFWPASVVLDKQNRVYVSDNTNRFQVFTTQGKFLGLVTDAGKHNPPLDILSTLWIDGKNNLYVADGGLNPFTGIYNPNERIIVYRIHP